MVVITRRDPAKENTPAPVSSSAEYHCSLEEDNTMNPDMSRDKGKGKATEIDIEEQEIVKNDKRKKLPTISHDCE